jgi:hypothetical protein
LNIQLYFIAVLGHVLIFVEFLLLFVQNKKWTVLSRFPIFQKPQEAKGTELISFVSKTQLLETSRSADMSTGNSTSAPALVSSQPAEENQWASELCECFTYRTQAEDLRFSPIFMPCTCFCPCVMMGRIKSRLLEEKNTGCCHMGTYGKCFCLGACCLCPCLPLFSLNIRQKAMRMNNVPGGCCEEWKSVCCACSLFQIYVSLDEWSQEKKGLTKTRSAKKKEEMRLKALQMKKKKETEGQLPTLPTQNNELTELVMTFMGDIMDDDEDDLSDDDDEDEDEVVDYDDDVTQNKNGNYSAIPSDSRESSHMPTKIDVLQVTIPPGHFGGSVFQIENKAGDVLEVTVPAGGKPGMKMQVPNKTATPPPPPACEDNAVMVQDGTIQVAIPPGHFAGHMFLIQSSRGDVMEVVVPQGGKPGMKMHIPNSFSQLLTPPAAPSAAPPVPVRTATPPQQQQQQQQQQQPTQLSSTQTDAAPKTTTKRKKIKKQRSSSPKRHTSPSGSRRIQVTIPEGCHGGDIFQLDIFADKGENIKVRVPQGGQPGMRVQIRIPSSKNLAAAKATGAPPPPYSSTSSTGQEKQTPLRKQPPVMRDSPNKNKKKEDKVTRHAYGSYGGGGKKIKKKIPSACVTIPSGVVEGEPFVALDANTGQQVLVIVPPGAKAGMVMNAEVVEDSGA